MNDIQIYLMHQKIFYKRKKYWKKYNRWKKFTRKYYKILNKDKSKSNYYTILKRKKNFS